MYEFVTIEKEVEKNTGISIVDIGLFNTKSRALGIRHLHLSSCLLLADSLISRICAMSSEPPLFPAQLLQARQSDLSVTSIPQSVNR